MFHPSSLLSEARQNACAFPLPRPIVNQGFLGCPAQSRPPGPDLPAKLVLTLQTRRELRVRPAVLLFALQSLSHLTTTSERIGKRVA